MKQSALWSFVLFAAALALCWGRGSAVAQPSAANPRFPGAANAILTIEVAKILQSPLAKQLEWQSKLMKGQADRPFAMPAAARRVTIGAALHPADMHSIWQAAMIEMPSAARLDPILRAQGGYMDQIGGKNALWTPKDAFYIELDPNTLAIVRPGQRQYASRWVEGKANGELAGYLKNAWSQRGDSDATFAVDLDDVVSLTGIRYVYSLGDLPSLENMNEGRQKLLQALASVKGMTLKMTVTDKIDGKMVVDFGEDVSGLGQNAKPFVIDVLKACDLYEPTADQWNFKVAGRQIVGEGTMATDAFSRLVALLSPPTDVPEASEPDGSSVKEKPAGATAVPAASKNDAAAASQRYYKVISGVLDSLAAKASPTQGATWLLAKSRQIEQLPILNVDADLVAWGGTISEALNRAAQELALGQQKAQIAAANIATPTSSSGYDATGGQGSETAESRAAFKNAQQQRRQAAQNERGAAAERAFGIFNQVLPTRAKIRAEMTQKYGVEF